MKLEIDKLRPCIIVSSDQTALFHGMFQQSYVRAPSYLQGGHPGGTVATPVAVVELEDGQIIYVEAHDIRFLDNHKFRDYCFGEAKGNE